MLMIQKSLSVPMKSKYFLSLRKRLFEDLEICKIRLKIRKILLFGRGKGEILNIYRRVRRLKVGVIR